MNSLAFDGSTGLTYWDACFPSCHQPKSFGPTALSTSPLQLHLSIAPAAVAGIVLLSFCLLPVLRKGPQWCKTFASEIDQNPSRTSKRLSIWPIILIVLSTAGLVLAVVSASLSRTAVSKFVDISPWVVSSLLLAIDRPRSTPKLLMVLFCCMLGCHVAQILWSNWQALDAFLIAEACVNFLAVVVILIMPMRDPSLESSEISKPFKEPNSGLRSPEDNLTLWQFMTVSWMSPLISRGYKRQLHDADVWKLPYDFQHTRLHLLFRDLRGSVVVRLLKANGLDLITTTFLGFVELVANLSTPVLLQQLLRSIELENGSNRAAIIYAALILVVRLVAAQSAVFSLWYCRRCYERSRGEMITMVYEKALTRKSFGFHSSEKPEEKQNGGCTDADEQEHQNGDATTKSKSTGQKLMHQISRAFGFHTESSAEKTVKPPKQPATMGKILNLLRGDVYEVAQRFWEFPNIFTKPLQLVLSVILVWKILGWPCLIGMACVIVVQLLNAVLVRILLRWERVRRAATDLRLQVTSQFVEAIRHLRWYDWQTKWLDRIMDARQRELRLRVVTSLWNITIATTNMLATVLFPVVSFWAYTVIAGRPLSVDVAFPALQIFNLLATSLKELPGLITVLLNATVAMGRIEDFMQEPDKQDRYCDNGASEISFENASFSWPGYSVPVLENVDLAFPSGLTVICGKVGAGKTALLQAVLGELDTLGGETRLPDEKMAYCAQSPWLQHMNIRQNILFSSPFDERRYKQVLEACALTPDLANFKHGDLSDLGENGIGLSGGQRARVALARAVYSPARILLLDDPIAALDHNTAETIVKRLFRGPLMEGRTALLVTHRLDLCCHLADCVVEVSDGKVSILDSDAKARLSKDVGTEEEAAFAEEEMLKLHDEQQLAAVPDKFIEEEYRAEGGVVASVYWQYIKAGKLKWWLTLIILFALFRVNRLLNYWFLKAWGEAYNRPRERINSIFSGLFDNGLSGLFDKFPFPESNIQPWLLAYLTIALIQAFVYFISDGLLLVIVYTAGKRLYKAVMQRVSRATFRFYDVTPVGRLMNRLTSDIGTLDGGISDKLQNVAWYIIAWVSSIVVIASVTPTFLVFSCALTVWFCFIFFRFLPTSQSLRRLEMVSLSPLMSNFGVLLDGLTTIRAFRAQHDFQDRVIRVTDAFQKMDHFYWSLQAWLMYRFDALSAFSTFALTLLALYDNLSPGLTAFMLTTASNFVVATHSLCKQYGQLQMDFVSVERVVELLHIEEEPEGTVDPPASWPAYGDDIVFDNITVKYAPHLEPSLSEVSFRIPGRSTTAVIGRTGSGKSTLALTLLATILPQPGGQIRVGNMDISKVNVHAWRQRISFVAQDPVLFPGTLRQNLDPINDHSDEECAAIIQRILGSEWSLSSRIEGGGKNLSQGQRQLVGIGRAVLRRSPVVILDEATASIDMETALWIQEVLREELRESTVITVAHRVEAVKDADYCIVLDSARVVAAGPPSEIMT
ncbi:ABC transporter [Phyllosticta capitalensis]|uniref:ABC transporter n=1 Tax=Phyllosticta capitalensis TaxID=121624 RepID=A0ABR1YLF8_9PEZI